MLGLVSVRRLFMVKIIGHVLVTPSAHIHSMEYIMCSLPLFLWKWFILAF